MRLCWAHRRGIGKVRGHDQVMTRSKDHLVGFQYAPTAGVVLCPRHDGKHAAVDLCTKDRLRSTDAAHWKKPCWKGG